MDTDSQLLKILKKQPLLIGIGNTLRQDDGAGVYLTQSLIDAGYSKALVVHSNPENYLQKINSINTEFRLWIDVVNWSAEPGEFRLFSLDEIDHIAISTHNFSLTVLINYLNQIKPAKDYLLGIQPVSIQLGEGLSLPVANTIDQLLLLMKKTLLATSDKRK